jgi:HD-GYP domain-containing protein (c-di-GMP phosphodiesterase class II)
VTEYNLSPDDVPVGTPLPWSVFDGQGKLLLHKGYVISRAITVASLFAQSVCRARTADAADTADRPPVQPSAPAGRCPFDVLAGQAERLGALLDDPDGGADFAGEILALAHDLQDICVQDGDAVLGSILLESKADYPIKHSVDTAIICEIVGTALHEPPEARRSIIAAALTMNIEMVAVQRRLHEQAGPLSTEDQAVVRTHPTAAVSRLERLGVTDPVWLQAIAQHHEIGDGSGYPEGLQVEQISLGARMIQLADNYAASLSPRAYRHSLASYQLVRDIFLQSGRCDDPALGGYFIKSLGSYPVGCRVRLSNGETGVVIRRTANLSAPIVMSLANSRQLPLKIPIKRDTGLPAFRISAILTGETKALDPYLLWGYLSHKP